MKNQFFGILFYLLYLLAMIRPIIPVIEYHANYDYIATVLCENRDRPYLECNGKCYLEKQLDKVNHTNHEHKSNIPQINFDDYPISLLGQYTFELNEEDSFIFNNQALNPSHIKKNYLSSVFKPPQFIS